MLRTLNHAGSGEPWLLSEGSLVLEIQWSPEGSVREQGLEMKAGSVG